MRTLEVLLDPALRGLYLPGLIAGLATALMCGLLSVLVVVKRLGFIGQGVSHSAFGGIGCAAVLGALGVIDPAGIGEFGVVLGFCVAAALGMAAVSDRRTLPEDTAIGLFLVASMALGAVLVPLARDLAAARGRAPDVRSWESILFGSITTVSWAEVWLSLGVAGAVTLAVALLRRPMLFWAFDEDSAPAFGVPTRAMRATLMTLLAVAVVTAMKLAGVVLATALLVLPGAVALRLSARLVRVVAAALLAGVLGVAGGLVLAIEADWPPGPAIVLVLTGFFVAAAGAQRLRGRA